MTTAEPPDDITSLLESLEFDEPTDVTDFTKLDARALLDEYNRVQRELTDRGELVDAETPEGVELHSRHSALLVELHRRNMR